MLLVKPLAALESNLICVSFLFQGILLVELESILTCWVFYFEVEGYLNHLHQHSSCQNQLLHQ